MTSSFQRGAAGEKRAADFIAAEGWSIVEKNFRGRRGEVDIVAVRDDTIAFVEVKSWNTLAFDSLEQGISSRKLRRIVAASREFLAANPGYDGFRARFDIVFVSNNGIERITDVLE